MFSVSPWCLPIRKSINLSLTVKVTWDPAAKVELDTSSLREPPGLFIHHQSVPVFLPDGRLLSSFYCFTLLFFSPGHSFCALPSYSKHIVSSPCGLTSLPGTCFPGIQRCGQKSCFLSCILFLWPCSLLLNTLKATSINWEGLIPKAPSDSCNFLLISGRFAQWRSYLPFSYFQGPQNLHQYCAYKLDKFFLETLMDPHWVFGVSLEFCLSLLPDLSKTHTSDNALGAACLHY